MGNEIVVNEKISENISVMSTTNLIRFEDALFEKTIDLRADVKLHFDTAYEVDKLNSRVNLVKGVTYDKNDQVYEATDRIILTADNITLSNKLNVVKQVYLAESFAPNEKSKLSKEDVFVCLSSGSVKHIGKVAYISADTQYYAGGFMGILRKRDDISDEKNVSMRYIYAILSSRTFREYLTEISKGMGSNIKNLNDSIGEFKFPFPPFEIQEKIAEELTLIDDAIDFEEQKEKILDKYLK